MSQLPAVAWVLSVGTDSRLSQAKTRAHRAVAVLKGRAVPLLGATYTKWKLAQSQNNREEGLPRLPRDPIPRGVPVILLADRGFGRTELAQVCQQLGFRYALRIKPDVWAQGPQYAGNLPDFPVRQGMPVVPRGVQYRRGDPVTHNVVIRWEEGLPHKRDERPGPWCSSNDPKQGSAFTIGRIRIDEREVKAAAALAAVAQAVEEAAPKWG